MEVHASLRAEDLFYLGPVPITNSMVMAWLALALLAIVGFLAGRNPQLVPTGVQNVVEVILEGLMGLVQNTAGPRARRVFPLIATLFLFIVTANYMALLPGVGTILISNPKAEAAPSSAGLHTAVVAEAAPVEAETATTKKAVTARHELAMIPLLRAANADVNMTLGMGLIAFLFIHGSGIAVHGLRGYWVNDLANPPLMTPIKLIIECFVPVSLSMRLFGNVFGGEMLMTVMSFPIIAIPFLFMELLFGLIQAVIFSLLTLIFTSLASYVPPGHGDDHGDAHGQAVQLAH